MAEVLVVNDRQELNLLYRKALMAAIEAEGHAVRPVGILNGGKPNGGALARLFFRLRGPVVSSNLRANLAALMVPWTGGMTIINGLGRYRGRRALRRALLLMMRVNGRKEIVFQSYADYRYFRRHGGAARKHWLPGSGGTARATGPEERLVTVQRNSKIAMVAESLAELQERLPEGQVLSIVGCTADSDAGPLMGQAGIEFTGMVPQEDIFAAGGTFVQPKGYGEGVPHTLVDALCSGMPVLIADIEFLRYGLHRLGAQREPLVNGWSRVAPDLALAEAVSLETVTRGYLDILRKRLLG